MTRRRFCSSWAAVAAIAYTAVAGYGAVYQHPEIFPAFNWSLFSFPPKVYEDWSVQLVEINGRRLDAPEWIERSAHFPAYDIGQAKQLRKWGQLQADGDLEAAQRQRSLFENIFRGKQQVRYRFVNRKALPLERWRTGDFESQTVIAEYTWRAGGS